jgi:uncharacterized protein YyaL (SSP411 family)
MTAIVTNRLAGESSPYLRQHADNPVHWQPWDNAALALARETGKPILLSIGYSACHWCHVMARESFADPATARRMNALFVNIKVDREERPDLDQIYQRAHLLIQQRGGGWPLTMFLTPAEHIPFFGGTYFPPAARHGLPAFVDVLERVAEFYRTRGDEIARDGAAIVEALDRLNGDTAAGSSVAGTTVLDRDPLERARAVIAANFDSRHGGFGTAPKFPQATLLEWLLQGWADSVTSASGEEDADLRTFALYTMERMGLGGLFDQLSGGFFRYSVDDAWIIPHFEKMLYDNGPLLGLFARAARLSGDERFARIAHATAAWLREQMQAGHGGFYATIDADANGEEGGWYLWQNTQARRHIGDETNWQITSRVFGLDRSPNFEDKWHLTIVADPEEVAEELEMSAPEVARRLDLARAALRQARAQRPAPAVDDKILTAWNALAIRGLAEAARALEKPDYADTATRAVDFITAELWQDGRLLATHKDGRSRLPAYLDDYVLLASALLALLEVRWRASDLDLAVALADALLEHFEDSEGGGFFFTAHDHEALIHRPKPFEDSSTPSGNGVAVQVLTKLGHLLGRSRYLQAAERTLQAGWGALVQRPQACAGMLLGLARYLDPQPTVILRGDGEALAAWQRRLFSQPGWRAAENATLLPIPRDTADAELMDDLQQRVATDAPVTAYVCRGNRCLPPVTTPEALLAALQGGPPAA